MRFSAKCSRPLPPRNTLGRLAASCPPRHCRESLHSRVRDATLGHDLDRETVRQSSGHPVPPRTGQRTTADIAPVSRDARSTTVPRGTRAICRLAAWSAISEGRRQAAFVSQELSVHSGFVRVSFRRRRSQSHKSIAERLPLLVSAHGRRQSTGT